MTIVLKIEIILMKVTEITIIITFIITEKKNTNKRNPHYEL